MKTAGYTFEEFLQIRNIDTVDKEKVSEEQFRNELAERLRKKGGITNLHLKSKQGIKIELKVEYKVFTYEDGWYLAGRALEVNGNNVSTLT